MKHVERVGRPAFVVAAAVVLAAVGIGFKAADEPAPTSTPSAARLDQPIAADETGPPAVGDQPASAAPSGVLAPPRPSAPVRVGTGTRAGRDDAGTDDARRDDDGPGDDGDDSGRGADEESRDDGDD